jgi:hypothetical protein
VDPSADPLRPAPQAAMIVATTTMASGVRAPVLRTPDRIEVLPSWSDARRVGARRRVPASHRLNTRTLTVGDVSPLMPSFDGVANTAR